MTPKKPIQSFTSLRIIGEKAQQLLAKARGLQKERAEQKEKMPVRLPEEELHDEVLVHLSIASVVKATFAILAIGLGVVLVYLLRDKLVLLLLSVFIAATIDPGVQALKRMGVPRGLAVLFHYFIALLLLLFLVLSLIPIIADQIGNIAVIIRDQVNDFLANPQVHLPLLSDEANFKLQQLIQSTLESLSIVRFTDALEQFGQNLGATAQGSLIFFAQLAGSLVNFLTNAIVVLVLAFFMQIEKEKIFLWWRSFLPRRYRAYLDSKSEVINFKLGQWARGQLLLCLSIGVLVFLALVTLRMPYALTLAILAGFTEFIPVVGPVFAAIPAVLIALTQHGWVWGLVVAAVYYVIQWCENNLLVPLIMKRAVGLSPIAILFAMLVGISFPGIIHPVIGIILSIPVTTIIVLFLEDWREMRMQQERKTSRA
jgi:predicted PurR-regulated permease PerM